MSDQSNTHVPNPADVDVPMEPSTEGEKKDKGKRKEVESDSSLNTSRRRGDAMSGEATETRWEFDESLMICRHSDESCKICEAYVHHFVLGLVAKSDRASREVLLRRDDALYDRGAVGQLQKIARVEHENGSLMSQLDAANAKIDRVNGRLDKAAEYASEFKREIRELRQENERLRAELEGAEGDRKRKRADPPPEPRRRKSPPREERAAASSSRSVPAPPVASSSSHMEIDDNVSGPATSLPTIPPNVSSAQLAAFMAESDYEDASDEDEPKKKKKAPPPPRPFKPARHVWTPTGEYDLANMMSLARVPGNEFAVRNIRAFVTAARLTEAHNRTSLHRRVLTEWSDLPQGVESTNQRNQRTFGTSAPPKKKKGERIENPTLGSSYEVWAQHRLADTQQRSGIPLNEDGTLNMRFVRGSLVVSRRAPRTNDPNPRLRSIFQLRAAQLLSVPHRYRLLREQMQLALVLEPAARPYTGLLDNLSEADVVRHFAATGVDERDADDAWLYARQWLMDRRALTQQSIFEPQEIDESITRMNQAVAEHGEPAGRHDARFDVRTRGIERPAEMVEGVWKPVMNASKVIKRIFDDDARQSKGINEARAQMKPAKPPKTSQGSQSAQPSAASTSTVQLQPAASLQLPPASNWGPPPQMQPVHQYPNPYSGGYLMPSMQQYGQGPPPNYMAPYGQYVAPAVASTVREWGSNAFGSERPIPQMNAYAQNFGAMMSSQPPPASGGSGPLDYGSPASELTGVTSPELVRPLPSAYTADVPTGEFAPTTAGSTEGLFGPYPGQSSTSSVLSPLLSQHDTPHGSNSVASSGNHSRSVSLPHTPSQTDMDQTMG